MLKITMYSSADKVAGQGGGQRLSGADASVENEF